MKVASKLVLNSVKQCRLSSILWFLLQTWEAQVDGVIQYLSSVPSFHVTSLLEHYWFCTDLIGEFLFLQHMPHRWILQSPCISMDNTVHHYFEITKKPHHKGCYPACNNLWVVKISEIPCLKRMLNHETDPAAKHVPYYPPASSCLQQAQEYQDLTKSHDLLTSPVQIFYVN